VSIPVECPNCGVGHLHASLYIDADSPEDRFQVVTLDGDRLVVRDTGSGALFTKEGHLLCCACDWSGDYEVDLTPERAAKP
jgi:hypothetical protein